MTRLRKTRDERGMTTAEYAVGTVASCGFAGVLVKLLSEPWVQDLLKDLFQSTIGQFF
jgi:Flp pilus assembly pilin Flp